MKNVIIFKYKRTGSIYAYTMRKEYAKRFEKERDMDVFEKLVIPIDKVYLTLGMTLQDFKGKAAKFVLTEEELYEPIDSRRYSIIVTSDENIIFRYACDCILDILKNTYIIANTASHVAPNFHIPDKILKIIFDMTISLNNKTPKIHINEFSLFYDLFRYTFDPESDIDSNELQNIIFGKNKRHYPNIVNNVDKTSFYENNMIVMNAYR